MKKILIGIIITLILIVLGYFGYLKYMKSNIDATPVLVSSEEAIKKTYTMEEVSKHAVESDCWLVINGMIIDVTTFIPQHPGGKVIVKGCGKDATTYFTGVKKHLNPIVESLKAKFTIGSLVS